jgi:glycosyltransferase involved in cell wall biosynthesis
LKIAVICDVLGQENNGTTIAAMRLIRSLTEKGHEVRIVCADAERKGQPGYYVVPQYNFGIFTNYVEKNGVAPAKLDQAVLEKAIHDADIIHVMLPFALGKAAAQYAEKNGIPLTAGFHCQAENITSHLHLRNCRPINDLTYKILYRRLYRYCDCIHYPTQFIADTFEAVVGPTPHRIISNGVSADFHPKTVTRPKELENRFVVLFTGRYSHEKCHRVLLKAAAKSRHREQLQLIFAGTGPLEPVLKKYAARLGLPAPIFRFFSREELVEVVNYADLYVHPAEIEIEAISCLEAIACGKVPLISDSPRSATRYFALTDKNLFRCNDAQDLAQKLDWWLEHPKQRAACAQSYLGYAKQFDFDLCMDQMEQMLLCTIEEKRRGC